MDRKYYIIVLIVLLFAFCLRFLYVGSSYQHPDEIIPAGVIENLHKTGTWDTNWKNAELPEYFKYDQYNFSSYIISLYSFSYATGSFGLFTYRLFSVICSVGAVLLLFLLGRKTGGVNVGISAAFLVSVAPILVQDAHYARPEAFLTFSTLLLVYLAWPAAGEHRAYRSFLASVLAGFLVACKISMLFFIWVPFLTLAWGFFSGKERISAWRSLAQVFFLMGLMVLGFSIGVPGAFKNPQAYLNGVRFLAEQYSSVHPGASLESGKAVAALLFKYFGSTLSWPVVIFFLAGLFFNLKERSWDKVLLAYFPVLFFTAFFASKPVFLERNLSHVVPLYILGSVYGLKIAHNFLKARMRSTYLNYIVVPILLASMSLAPSYWTYKLVFDVYSLRHDKFRAEFEEKFITKKYKSKYFVQILPLSDELFHGFVDTLDYLMLKGNLPIVISIGDNGYGYSSKYIVWLERRYRMEPLGKLESIFEELPPSTLQTYHSWAEHYFLITGVRFPVLTE